MKLSNLYQNNKTGEIEINTIIKLILIGIGLIIMLVIINQIFTENVSSGFDEFFNLFG